MFKRANPGSLLLVLVVALALVAAGCGKKPAPEQQQAAPEQPKAEQKLELKFATTMSDSGIDKEVTQKFKQRLEELSNGSITVALFMAGQMGGEKEALELLKLGELDLGYNAYQASMYYPEYNVTQIPFLFPNYDSINRFLSGPAGKKIEEVARQKGGLIIMGTHGYGSRWTTSNKPFKNAAELKGLKIRMPEIPDWINVWKGMGALPTPIASNEIVTALKTGTVDAQENFLTNIAGRKMWEYQKYSIATEHVDLIQTWLFSEKTWNKMSAKQREIVQKAVDEAVAYVQPRIDELNKQFINEIKGSGMEIIYPDRNSLQQAAEPAVKSIIDKLAPGVYDEALQAINKK